MALLTQSPPASSLYNASTSQPPDDVSGRAHRQLIGYIGLVLPILLVLIDRVRHRNVPGPWGIQDSISAYYYTGAVAAFVGLLIALALFLFTYRGYKNKYQWADRAVAVTAAVAAVLVAFFPTRVPEGTPAPAWWTQTTGVLHYVSAIVLFSMFAVFSLWLFRLTARDDQPPADKRRRNGVYLVCGVVIVGSMVWAGVAGASGKPIFLPESFALVAFAASWLIKGQAHKTIANAARSITGQQRAE